MKTCKHIPLIIFVVILLLSIGSTAIYFLLYHQPAEITTTSPEPTPEIPGQTPPYTFDYSWSKNHPYIAHAMGGIFGDSYTNSYEAFLLNYAMGHRVFEVDLLLSDEGKLLATHDRTGEDFTRTQFLSKLSQDKYHHLDARTLVQIMSDYPDIYIVTDTKGDEQTNDISAPLAALVRTAQELNCKEILDRIIIQIYHPNMLASTMQVYPWKSIIYTLYANPDWTPENVKSFAETSGVKYITMWDSWITPEIMQLWSPTGIKVAAHTINDLDTVSRLHALGVTTIYTDFLLP